MDLTNFRLRVKIRGQKVKYSLRVDVFRFPPIATPKGNCNNSKHGTAVRRSESRHWPQQPPPARCVAGEDRRSLKLEADGQCPGLGFMIWEEAARRCANWLAQWARPSRSRPRARTSLARNQIRIEASLTNARKFAARLSYRRDTPTLPDLVEEPFDQVPRAIQIRAEADRVFSISFGGMFAQAPCWRASSLIQSAS